MSGKRSKERIVVGELEVWKVKGFLCIFLFLDFFSRGLTPASNPELTYCHSSAVLSIHRYSDVTKSDCIDGSHVVGHSCNGSHGNCKIMVNTLISSDT